MNSRRGFLKTGLVLGGATLVGGGLWYKKNMRNRVIAEQLVYFLDYPEIAIQIGQGLLDSDTRLYNISPGKMANRLLQSMSLSESQLLEFTHDQLLEVLHQKVRADFIEEHIVFVNRWLLSQTEAGLCSVLALLVNSGWESS